MNVLSIDLETSPYRGYFFGVWNQNIGDAGIDRDKSILCASYSWLYPKTGEYTVPETISVLDNKKAFKNNPWDDSKIIQPIYDLFEEADVVVGHNVNGFDYKTFNTRAFVNGLPPLPPRVTIDTLSILRSNFSFAHNRLDAIGKKLGIGGKKETGGFQLWIDVMNGSEEAMERMAQYCERDVELLNELYFMLRAWDKKHPCFNIVDGTEDACPTCENIGTLKGNPSWLHISQTRTYPRFKCTECGSWTRGIKSINSAKTRKI